MNFNLLDLKTFYSSALLTPEQMYQADNLTIKAGISGTSLMANAGQVVADELTQRLPVQEALIICGTGNNGGDGFIVAKLLSQAGWPVKLAIHGNPKTIKGDAKWALAQYDGPIYHTEDVEIPNSGLIVDAILGAGLNRPLSNDLEDLITKINKSQAFVCSIDVPTGLNGANGLCNKITVNADLTICFFRAKPGHFLLPGRSCCGELISANIGIDNDVLDQIKPSIFLNQPNLWLDKIRWPDLSDHKYKRGHVLMIGGAKLLGAARLSALAAARIGAGLVTLAVPAAVWPIQSACMTSVMVESFDPKIGPDLSDARRNVIIIGPGLGLQAEHKKLVLDILKTERSCVLDADALSLFADNPSELFSALHTKCVLTPHSGEFSRLFQLEGDKLSQLTKAVQQTGATVLLKGADTIIAAANGLMVINHNAPAYLATAGSGDVLSGCIAGLLANGMNGFDAACAAVWLHGQAANNLGFGLLAEDLPLELPKVLAKLKANRHR